MEKRKKIVHPKKCWGEKKFNTWKRKEKPIKKKLPKNKLIIR
jgi:hypothetical protein